MATIDVELTTGVVAATLTNSGLVVARGIPYGVSSRFEAATPFPAWNGNRDATSRGPICPQRRSRLAWLIGDVTEGMVRDEQCLVLTVSAPAEAKGLPVMVWIHGGAYTSGTGEADIYDADDLVAEGSVVVVSVSYRLGVFGYLTPEGCGDANLGLRDQILAFKWVRDNIEAFGGDPARVTAFGQSAGAHSVWALMLSPEADGLFHRAILQSAPLGVPSQRASMNTAMRASFTDAVGSEGSTPTGAAVDEMLDMELVATNAAHGFPAAAMPYAPTGGEEPMVGPGEQTQRLATIARSIDLLIGYTAEDAAPFEAMKYFARNERSMAVLDNPAFRDGADALTAASFGRPAAELARHWTENGGRAATYLIGWAPQGAPMGACHCIELPLLFGTPAAWAKASMLGPTSDPIDRAVARRMRQWWSQFAHSGTAELPAHLDISG